VSLVLNFLLRLISYQSRFKNVFREVGIFTMLINGLKVYASDLEEKYRTEREDIGEGEGGFILRQGMMCAYHIMQLFHVQLFHLLTPYRTDDTLPHR